MKTNKTKPKALGKEKLSPLVHKVTLTTLALPFVGFLGKVFANGLVLLIMLTFTVIFGHAAHWVLTTFDAMKYAELFEEYDNIIMRLEYIYFVLTVAFELLEYIVLSYNRIIELLKKR